MKAMILAAGAGSRMGKLTQHTPKPLLPVNGKPLLVHLIEKIAAAGFSEIVLNVYHFPEQFQHCLGNGDAWGIPITLSYEETLLGPAGGVINALPLLGDNPFLVISGDIWTNYPLHTLRLEEECVAHCILVPNPIYHQQGDFALTANGFLSLQENPRYTYGNIGLFTKAFFKDSEGIKEFAPLFKRAIEQNKISGDLYHGLWHNVGTPEQLDALNTMGTT
ncbi:MAG: nucleotidyltransferase family protein [Gammaproteobacteria bacterium]